MITVQVRVRVSVMAELNNYLASARFGATIFYITGVKIISPSPRMGILFLHQ